jgi:hypothetical protein
MLVVDSLLVVNAVRTGEQSVLMVGTRSVQTATETGLEYRGSVDGKNPLYRTAIRMPSVLDERNSSDHFVGPKYAPGNDF